MSQLETLSEIDPNIPSKKPLVSNFLVKYKHLFSKHDFDLGHVTCV